MIVAAMDGWREYTTLLHHHFFVKGGGFRPPCLHVIPYVPGKSEGQFFSLDQTDNALVLVALESGEELVVAHGEVAGELGPELGDFRGLGDLELKLVVSPVEQVCVVVRDQ